MAPPRLRLVADLADQIYPLYPDKVCIGPDGDLWVIAYDCPPSDIELADPDLSDPAEMTVLNFDGATLKSAVTLRDPVRRSRFPDHRLLGFVQPLGADEVLLVAARTAGEPNARVVDLNGITVREFMLGDGIYDVQTTRAGEIWVSYYDQGTSIGCWPVQDTSDSIPYSLRDFSKPIEFHDGSNNEHFGLLRTTDQGEVSWRFSNTKAIEPIFDCDGHNVFGDGSAAWTCYSPFPGTSQTSPIVRIDRDGTRRVWRLDGGSRQALAVQGETIALGGGWGDDYGWFSLGRLGEGDAVEDLAELGIHDEAPQESRVIGRGPVIHWIQGTRWHVLDLRD